MRQVLALAWLFILFGGLCLAATYCAPGTLTLTAWSGSRDQVPTFKSFHSFNASLPQQHDTPWVIVVPVEADEHGSPAPQLEAWLARLDAAMVAPQREDALVPRRFHNATAGSIARVPGSTTNQGRVPVLIAGFRRRESDASPSTDQPTATLIAETTSLDPASHGPSPQQASPSDRRVMGDLEMPQLAAVSAVRAKPRPIHPLLLAGWLTNGLLLPWLGLSILTRAADSDSSLASATLVITYLAVMSALAWYFWGRFEPSMLSMGSTLVVCAFWLKYLELVYGLKGNHGQPQGKHSVQ